MKVKHIKTFVFFFLLFFIFTTIIHTFTGFHSRWDFGFYKLTLDEYINALFPRGILFILISAILFPVLSINSEKYKKNNNTKKDKIDDNENIL